MPQHSSNTAHRPAADQAHNTTQQSRGAARVVLAFIIGMAVMGAAWGLYTFMTSSANNNQADTQMTSDEQQDSKDTNTSTDTNANTPQAPNKHQQADVHNAYAEALKQPATYLKKKDGSSFKYYRYLVRDANSDKVDDLILIGSDEPGTNPKTFSVALCFAEGKKIAQPAHVFEFSPSLGDMYYLSTNKKDDTCAVTSVKGSTYTSDLYARFDGSYRKVEHKVYQSKNTPRDFSEDRWNKVDIQQSLPSDDLTGVAQL
ncbi:hypothetical protein ACNF5J_05810 [Fannyhessea vaginae]|uniref:hypothetical protein n=1 Tax=Fannyhessea vaginae TaxID=82135 RepID=UPI003A80B612